MAQPDPSHSVSQELMSHVHLVSSFRYPAIPRLDFNEVAKWLLNAPQIARDRAPFFWTFLDKPGDGTILLVWQPLGRLGTNFATDGLIWAPPEQIYKHELGNGLILEIYYLKAGYIPGEQVSLHTRRRFRLVPVVGHPNPPPTDPSLFIVHYGPAEPSDRVPITMIPYDERVNAIMQQRHFLLRSGQIRRKEFMLSDRVNWPSLPELTRQQMGPQITPRGVPQQMAYPSQPPAGPPAKRARHAQSQAQQGSAAGMPAMEAALDDDEDISRGDMFDHLTPREISMSRYQLNHEWMEEILSSAYRISQIIPADLGLGQKGELAPLTDGIFTSQGGEAFDHAPEKAYVGRLDAGQANEFRKRVEGYISSTKSEMEAMEQRHLETIAKFRKASLVGVKEKELRALADDANIDGEDSAQTMQKILQQVEAATGRKIVSTPVVNRVQDGGYQVSAPEPAASAAVAGLSRQSSPSGSQASGLMLGENDMDMGGTAAGLLDQMHTGLSSTSTPNNSFPTPTPTPHAQLSATQSGAATPSQAANTASPAAPTAAAPTTDDAAAPAPATADATATAAAPQPAGDVAMGGTNDGARTTPDQGTESGDWVVVPKGETPAATAASATSGTAEAEVSKPPAAPATGTTKPPSAAATPAVTEGGSITFDQNDFSSLGDLDTAGDALAGYDASDMDGGAGGLGDGLDLPMDMEDTAFGDAFHGVEASDTPGDGQGQDL